MKKLILILITTLVMGRVFAQDEYRINDKSKVVYSPDTVTYSPGFYRKTPKNANIYQLIKFIREFEIIGDSLIVHWGQKAHKFAINGKVYTSVNMIRAIKKLPADMVENIVTIDDYKDAIISIKTPEFNEFFIINIKANNLAKAQQKLLAASILAIDEKVTQIRLDCRDYFSETLAQLPINRDASPEPNIDDYGDQVPHFLIQPKPGTWTSKATMYQ